MSLVCRRLADIEALSVNPSIRTPADFASSVAVLLNIAGLPYVSSLRMIQVWLSVVFS